ncbi:DUF3450 family protein [Pelagicoccus albus]|uniref:DUF3450 family protein n=1 Tax=Pelagicoccus albus TaxID=415222 RepID=A0A7X1B550_9BACT|nr:DUF3450 family protein [Pelagicoccus albus]MBC2604575.1 DUF3450 family protein [Pelagicoccus albus]
MIKTPRSATAFFAKWLAAALLISAPCALPQTSLERAKSLPLETIELHTRAASEKSGWQTDKEILQHSLYTLRQTIAELDRKIAESKAQAQTHLATSQRASTNLAQFQDGQAILKNRIESLQTATLRLARYAPPPLTEKIAPSLRTLEGATLQEDLSLRIQAVTSILINLIQFNQTFSDVRSLHTFPDGSSQEVRILYLGLAQGVAVNGDSSSAWILTPAPGEWVWTEVKSSTQQISTAFSVLDRDTTPKFAELPVRLTTIDLDRE